MNPCRKARDVHWLLVHRKLPLAEQKTKWFPDTPCICPHCQDNVVAFTSHIFVDCPIALNIWSKALEMIDLIFPSPHWLPTEELVISGLHPKLQVDSVSAAKWRLVHTSAVYAIWVPYCLAQHDTLVTFPSSQNLFQHYLKIHFSSLSLTPPQTV